jgi:hypothetical protein
MDMESFAFDLLQVGLRTWKQMIHHLFFERASWIPPTGRACKILSGLAVNNVLSFPYQKSFINSLNILKCLTEIKAPTKRNKLVETDNLWTYRYTDMQTFRRTDLHTYRHADMQTSRHADIQTCRHADMQTC